MDFKSADKASVKTPKRSPSVGRKKKDKSAEKAADDLTGIPTPKLEGKSTFKIEVRHRSEVAHAKTHHDCENVLEE